MKDRWNKENIINAVNKSKTKLETLNNLGLKHFTGNYDTLNKYLNKYNIDISHFTRGNINNLTTFKAIPLSNILIKNSTYSNRTRLKKRLYDEGLKERKCEKCGQDELWNGEKMSLILDHINGINNDNRIENLRIVCPNCNATLPTHCGKNTKDKSQTTYSYSGRTCNCGKKIKKNNKTGFCRECLNNKSEINTISKNDNCQRKVKNRPTYEHLKKEIEETNYSAVGRKYGVSDNAIRKWMKKYEKDIFK